MKRILLGLIFIITCSALIFPGGGSQKADQKVTINVMDAQAYALERSDEVAQNFARLNNVNVVVQHNANNHPELLQARVNSGQVPDVFTHTIGPEVEAYADFGVDWRNEPVLNLFRDDVLQDCIKDGKVYTLPWIGEVYSLIYNKKVFRDANITTLPRNLRELEEVCIKIKNSGVTPFATGFGASWVLGHIASSYFAAENTDARVTVNAISSGQKSLADLTYFKNVFDLIDMMLKYGPDKPLEYDWERSEAALAAGEAGIIHMGSWAEAIFKQFNPDIEMGFIPTPVAFDNSFEPKIAAGTGWGYIVHKDGKNVDIAKKFLEYYLTSDDAVDFMSQAHGAIPPLKKQPANINGQLSNDASRYVAQGLVLPWAFNRYPAGANLFISDTLQAYAAGDVSREDAMRMMTNEWRMLK